MPSRRKFVAGSIAVVTASAGCSDVRGNDGERDELYEEVLDTYGEGETDFVNAMDDFERGEELFRDESYAEAERYFRDADRGFDSAAGSFADARSMISDLEELNSVVGDAEGIIGDSWDAAIAFSTYADLHRGDCVQAQDNRRIGETQFEATQKTISDEGHPRRVTTRVELMSQFIE